MEKSFNKTSDTFSSEVLYRFQVVSQIISLIQEEKKLVDAVRMVHSTKFMDAKGNWRRTSIRTLYRWHAAYNGGGVEALKPKLREKITSSLVVPVMSTEMWCSSRKSSNLGASFSDSPDFFSAYRAALGPNN